MSDADADYHALRRALERMEDEVAAWDGDGFECPLCSLPDALIHDVVTVVGLAREGLAVRAGLMAMAQEEEG